MPIYRVQYRDVTDDPDTAWTVYVDPAPSNAQTDGAGNVDTGDVRGSSVTVSGLSNGRTYQVKVERVSGAGALLASSTAVTAVPNAPEDVSVPPGDGSVTSDSGTSGELATRNGAPGMFVNFGNASWQTARIYFRPRADTTWPGYVDGATDAPNLIASRTPKFNVAAASVAGSGDPTTSCFRISNQQLFVPFDYTAYDIRVAAVYNSNTFTITLESPTT